MECRIEIKGVEELTQLLKQLPMDLRDKYGREGMKDGAGYVVMAVQGRMPVATGLARQSIGASPVRVYEQSGTLFCAIEPRPGFRRIVTTSDFEGTVRVRVRGRKVTKATAAFGRVQDPRRYMHLIEKGRRAVVATNRQAMHSALDVQNRFFVRAAAVAPHPVFGPVASSMAGAVKVAVETQLERGIQEFNSKGNNAG